MLELNDVHTYYGESFVLQGVSFKVAKNSIVALLGRNGVGKTTTIRSIIGFIPPRKGVIRFKGRDITGLQPYQIAQQGIGLIPQGRHIFHSLSVEENLTMPARTRGKSEAWHLDRVYSHFPVLKKRAKCRGSELSGGSNRCWLSGEHL